MKIILTTCVAASMMIVSCGGGDTLTAELNDLAKDLEKSNEELEENLDAALEEMEASLDYPTDLYESVDGNFKINFIGGTPSVTSEAIPTEVGNIEITMFMYEKSATEVYVVSYNDYPSDIIEVSSVDDLLAGGKDGVVSSMGITHFDLEEEVSLEGHSGLHFRGIAGTYHIEYEMYLVENRLYQIGILRDGSYPDAGRVSEFFGTFELTNQ